MKHDAAVYSAQFSADGRRVVTASGDTGRAGDSGGSRRFLGLPLRAEIRIPAPEGILPLFVEHPSASLQS